MIGVLLAESWWERNGGAFGIGFGIAGTLLGVAGLIYAWTQRHLKTFDWQVMTDEEILHWVAVDTPGELIQVFWRGQRLRKPRLIKIRLLNTGMQAIRSEDFETPVDIHVPGTKVMSAEPSGQRWDMVHRYSFRWEADHCYAQLSLHNRGDYTDVRLLVDVVAEPIVDKGLDGTDEDLSYWKALAIAAEREPITVECVIADQARPMRERPSPNSREARERGITRAMYLLIAMGTVLGVLLAVAVDALNRFF